MSRGLPPAALSALYVQRLAMIRNRAGALVAHAFAGKHLERLTTAQWDALIGALYVAWVGTQLDAITTADSYMAATMGANGLTVPRSPLIRALYAGLTVAGTPILDVLGATRRIVDIRVTGGASFAESLAASESYLMAAIGSDPHRLARDTVLDMAQGNDARILGWARVAEPGACNFCRMLATRGAVYTSRATASVTAGGSRYHYHCKCYVEPATNELDKRRGLKAGAAEWARMLETGDVPKSARKTARPAAATADGVRRHQQLQLQQLEGSIPALRSRVAAGDTAAVTPLAWQQGRVEELRRLLAAAA